LECILLCRLKWKQKLKKKTIYTVCNGEQSVVGIEFVDRNDPHKDDDDEVENVGDIGDDAACGIGSIGESVWFGVEPSKWRNINAT